MWPGCLLRPQYESTYVSPTIPPYLSFIHSFNPLLNAQITREIRDEEFQAPRDTPPLDTSDSSFIPPEPKTSDFEAS